MFPFPNPMRPDSQRSLGDGNMGSVLFPTGYRFQQDIHGVPQPRIPDITTITTSGTGHTASMTTSGMEVRVVEDSSLCWDAGFGGDDAGSIYMGDCVDGSENQKFTYDPITFQIKHTSDSTGTRCVDYDSGGTKNVYLNENCLPVLNQKWRFNVLTQELSTFIDDGTCLDWNTVNNNIYMHACTGNANQVSCAVYIKNQSLQAAYSHSCLGFTT